MIQVWGRTNSSNVMKLLWLLDELGLEYERIDAGMAFGRNDTDEYRAMNPYGLVPVLRDGSVSLFESNSILRYLCNTHAAGHVLYPSGPVERARVEAWMDAQISTMGPLGTVFLQLVRVPSERRDAGLLSTATAQAAASFAILETKLANRAFLAGDSITLADFAFGPFVHRWLALPIARPPMPGLEAYYRRLCERPAYVARCAEKLS